MPKTGNHCLALLALLLLCACDDGKRHDTRGCVVDGWPVWGHTQSGQRYSANTQITPENVKDLKVAWTYRTGDLDPPGGTKRLAFEATPILANNTLYLCSPRSRIAALDPVTGKEKWMRDLKPDTDGSTVIVCRGVSYWKDAQAQAGTMCSQRIFAGTIDGKMWALDADTGKPCADFGKGGRVDLHDNLGFIEKPGLYGVSSAPTIVGDKVITGSKIIDFHHVDMPGGVVRALDARSGAVVWAFTAASPNAPPGDGKTYPRSIARELNISRIPVREALSQLQEQGLVQNRERRGMFVTNIRPEEVLQISSLRIVLETEALRLARARMTPEIIARLEALVAKMNAWDGTLLEAAALDLEFHREICKATGNPYLERALNALMVPLFAHKTLEHVTQEIRRWRLSHHRIILDAVVGRSDDDPQEALLTHMRMSYTEPERYLTLAKRPS